MKLGQKLMITEKGRRQGSVRAKIVAITDRYVTVKHKNGCCESFLLVDVRNNLERDFKIVG